MVSFVDPSTLAGFKLDGTTVRARRGDDGAPADLTCASFGIEPGYGAGGTVTQATSKTTGVTLNTITGQITMNAAALAAGTVVSFTLTSSKIAANDIVLVNHMSGGTVGSYNFNSQPAAGSAVINVRNNTAGSLSEAIVLQYVVVKSTAN